MRQRAGSHEIPPGLHENCKPGGQGVAMHTTSLATLLKSASRQLPHRLSNDGWWLVGPPPRDGEAKARVAVCETQMEAPLDRSDDRTPDRRD
jgi:hypothetical protein